MRVARLIMVSSTHAIIHLQPSWWERLLGWTPAVCELKRDTDNEHGLWRSRYTGVSLGVMTHGGILRYALEFQPIVDEAEMVYVPVRLLKGVDE